MGKGRIIYQKVLNFSSTTKQKKLVLYLQKGTVNSFVHSLESLGLFCFVRSLRLSCDSLTRLGSQLIQMSSWAFEFGLWLLISLGAVSELFRKAPLLSLTNSAECKAFQFQPSLAVILALL